MENKFKSLLMLVLLAWTSIQYAKAYDFSAVNDEGVTIYYNILSEEDKTCEVTRESNNPYSSIKYTGDLNIPSIANKAGMNYTVTTIGEYAFQECNNLKSVTIANSVTTIKSYAFDYCEGLRSVSIPNTVVEMGYAPFVQCPSLSAIYGECASEDHRCLIFEGKLIIFAPSGLTKYTIPDEVTSIGTFAFGWCCGLRSITIPNSVTSIDSHAIVNCTVLASLKFPDSISYIGDSNGSGCSSLQEITIGRYITHMGCLHLEECFKLTTINYNAINCTDSQYSFQRCWVRTLNIGDEVETIPAGAFRECYDLSVINMGKSVKSIGANSFYCCQGIKEIHLPNSLTSIGNKAFYGCENLATVYNNSNLPIVKGSTDYGYVAYYANEVIGGPVPATAITLNNYSLSIKEGESETLIATVTPANTTEVTTWNSSDAKIATVESNGLVTAISKGTATITATCGKVSATCAVTVDYSQAITDFLTNNAEILRKTTATVKSSDLEAIDKALEDFSLLSDKDKEKITAQKKLLDSLKEKAEELKRIEAEINTFKANNEHVLGLTDETVKSSDIDAINQALTGYESLSEQAKTALAAEKKHLDEILAAAEAKKKAEEEAAAQAEANKYRNDCQYVYGISIEAVDLTDKGAVNKAIEDYAKLSDRAKEIVKPVYDHIVELKQEIDRLENEIAEFKENNAKVISKTVDDVKSSDLDMINQVLSEFDKLSDKAKAALGSEKKHLEELLAAAEAKKKAEEEEAAAQAAANKFKAEYESVLSETIATVELTDKEAVNKAIEDYSKLSDRAKEIVKTDYDNLVALQNELNRLENEIADFKKYNSIVLSKTLDDVKSSDLDLINEALSEFNQLSTKAKTALAAEKKHLDELLAAAEAKKKAEEEEAQVQAEVTKFKLDNAYVLSRTAESVQSTDLDAINKALADYEKLSDRAKDALKDTKSNLDALKITAEEKKQAEEQEKAVQAEITQFKLDNAYILSRSIDVIQSNDLAAIDKALSDFDKLSDDAKAVLAYQKELLDALKEKAEEIKKAEEEAAAVEKEVTEFCYNNGEVLTKTTDSVTAEDLDAINKALADYENLSDKAKEELAEVKKHLDELKNETEAQKQTTEDVKEFKDNNKDIIDKTVADVTPDNLDAINKALEDYENLSDRAKDELTEVKKHLDELKEEAEAQKQTAEEVKNFKDENKEILDKTVADVTPDDLDAINKALDDYENLSDRAKEELAGVKEHLDDLKEQAEAQKQTAEDVKNFKENNKEILDKTVADVTPDDLEDINKALVDYNNLSDRAKEELADVKEHLDELKEETEAQKQTAEDVKDFKDNNKEILDKTVANVTPEDLDAINKALEDYENLSDRAKEELSDVKEHLDELKKEAEAQKQTAEDVKEFKDNNKDIIDKTVADVTLDDLDAINRALADYENLSDKAKVELSDVKKHLDELKNEAEAQMQTAEDVKNFKDNNKEILDKTVADVTPGDLDTINKALEDYENLSDRAKEELSDVKDHLDELKEEAEDQKQTAEDVKEFKGNNKEILDKTVEGVTADDLEAINKALEDYEKLSDRAKEELSDVKEHLDELKDEAEAQKQTAEDVKEFKDNNKEILDKSVADVTPDDLDAINKALEDYKNLSDRAKEELADVKEHLDELKEEAEAQKQTAEDVKEFKDNNKEILDKTVEDVTADDLDNINKALEDYENLSDRAKEELSDVKEHLDELMDEAEAKKQIAEEVEGFREKHKEILDKTVDKVTADDLDAINQALSDYENLSDRAKEELAKEKELLDALKEKAESLGMSSICVDEDENVKTYDLQGHIISNNAKGLIIQNGKKVYRR